MKDWDTEKLFKEGFATLPNEYIGWVQRQSFAGKSIQCRGWKDKGKWDDEEYPHWYWDILMYRVAPEEPKKLMTNRQIAEWLARGNGEFLVGDGVYKFPTCYLSYKLGEECEEAHNTYLIRRWKSDEWIRPTIEIYEEDCK